jgi:hypothetical protein
MGDVIDLNERRKKNTADNSGIIQEIKNSLDNEGVKRRYGLNTPPPPPAVTEQERLANIRASIERVNKLMAELQEGVKK